MQHVACTRKMLENFEVAEQARGKKKGRKGGEKKKEREKRKDTGKQSQCRDRTPGPTSICIFAY